MTAPAAAIHDGGAHLFWAQSPSPSLTESMATFGQLQPVLVHETDSGLSLIAGHARLAALDSLKQPVMARVAVDPDPVDLGLLYLTDNQARLLDDAMRLKALRYFAPLMDAPELARTVLPLLGVRSGSKDATLLTQWLALPAPWHDCLTAGRIPLAAGSVLARMDEGDRNAVAPLFEAYSWSRSNAVNLLTWLFETSRMTGAPVASVMKAADMAPDTNPGLSPKDAMARLATQAKAARYPALSGLEARFDAAAREVVSGTRWRVVQPDNFETGAVTLTVTVADREQLATAAQTLQAMADRPQWPILWAPGADND
jgi:ParB family chromosome partitioning protein